MTGEAAERETVIWWSDADDGIAVVWTAQRPIVTRLQRIRGAERVEVHRTDGGAWTGETWRVPVAAVLPRNPARPTYTEAQRAAMRERGRNLRPAVGKSDRGGHSGGGPGLPRDPNRPAATPTETVRRQALAYQPFHALQGS